MRRLLNLSTSLLRSWFSLRRSSSSTWETAVPQLAFGPGSIHQDTGRSSAHRRALILTPHLHLLLGCCLRRHCFHGSDGGFGGSWNLKSALPVAAARDCNDSTPGSTLCLLRKFPFFYGGRGKCVMHTGQSVLIGSVGLTH